MLKKFLILLISVLLLASCAPYSPPDTVSMTAPPVKKERRIVWEGDHPGLGVATDTKTGCQYLTFSGWNDGGRALTPLLTSSGEPYCG